jgi:hypothetical protein
MPPSVKSSPLREAIFLTNQSVRRFKCASSYISPRNDDSRSNNYASKDHISKLKEMITLPRIGKIF